MNRMIRVPLKAAAVLWASPYSLLGGLIGTLGLLSGGRARYRAGAVEFYGGFTTWFVRHLPPGPGTLGFTLGHVILGTTAVALDRVGGHERVHVRQFERWGPVMGPAYLLASLWLWYRGGDAYRDNPFEVEAFTHEVAQPPVLLSSPGSDQPSRTK